VNHLYAGYLFAQQVKGSVTIARPSLVWADSLDEANETGIRLAKCKFNGAEGWINHASDYTQVPDEWVKKRMLK
jgi:hypothetical protein